MSAFKIFGNCTIEEIALERLELSKSEMAIKMGKSRFYRERIDLLHACLTRGSIPIANAQTHVLELIIL